MAFAGEIDAFEASGLYQTVYDYVETYMSQYDPSHDFSHVLRVVALAKRVLGSTPSTEFGKPLDARAVVLGALLHDVGDKKYCRPGESASDLLEKLLTKAGCAADLAIKVALIVEHTSFSSEIKRPQAVRDVIALHPELAVVQDADRLDAIGAIGIGRCFVFGGVKAPDRGMDGTIEHFVEKLERLEGMMKTDAGRVLARERTRRLKEFRAWWSEEQILTS